MFGISNLTNKKLPQSYSHFKKIKELILGKRYDLSLVFISAQKSKALNKKYRSKNKPANILSFPLEKNAGEIFINLNTTKDAYAFKMPHKKYIQFLMIHGCLHLKGFDHGNKMSDEEKKFFKKLI